MMRASIEVLSDGSELTEPAIFLTIRRHNVDNAFNNNDDVQCIYYEQQSNSMMDNAVDNQEEEGTIISRYNLSGMPSLTGRISSDQSYKLLQNGAFRAILIPSLITPSFHNKYDDNEGCNNGGHYNGSMRGASLGGLPSLFLSLIQSGYKIAQPTTAPTTLRKNGDKRGGGRKQLGDSSDSAPEIDDDDNNSSHCTGGNYGDISIIGPPTIGITIDGILDTMFGNARRRPSIRICEVPNSGSSNSWWEVYNDSYVKIWGQSVAHHHTLNELSLCTSCLDSDKEEELVKSDSSTAENTSDDDISDDAQNNAKHHGNSNDTSHHSIVYIVMLLPQKGQYRGSTGGQKQNNEQNKSYSFAIMPSNPSSQFQKCPKCGPKFQSENADNPLWKTLRNLPQEIISNGDQSALLEFIMHLDPVARTWECDFTDRYSNKAVESNNEMSTSSNKRQRKEPRSTNNMKSRTKKIPLHIIQVPSWVNNSKLTNYHLATVPNHTSLDEGLLIRAQGRSKLRHNSFPFAFPISSNHNQQFQMSDQPINENRSGITSSSAKAFGLRSCTSVVLNGWDSATIANQQQPFKFVSRVEDIRHRCKDSGSKDSPVSDDIESTVRSLECAFHGGPCFCGECSMPAKSNCTVDNNEIDLDSDSGDNLQTNTDSYRGEECTINVAKENSEKGVPCQNGGTFDVTSPHILMLGTGCATPSPLRGSSAYGLLLPTALDDDNAAMVLSAIIECGEGTLTGLLRHLPSPHSNGLDSKLSSLDVHLSHVNFIWISHAHLDHYGELPFVVQAIANAKKRSKHSTQQKSSQLLVIAPSKVLKYLNNILDQSTTLSRKKKISDMRQQLYIGVTHRELQFSPFARHVMSIITEYTLLNQQTYNRNMTDVYHPFASLQSVEVEHCRESFGLVLTMNIPLQDAPSDNHIKSTNFSRFILCFSGDTRPSDQLVQECKSYAPQRINLLVHEGTFLHDSQGQIDAARKRHSTTIEALDVAKRMRAECCVLTHFSQRYKHVSVNDVSSHDDLYPFNWGIAIDGMMIPMTKRALSSLNKLSKCIDAFILC